MLIACLYLDWQQDGKSLWSFAVITDEPTPEVAGLGHDRRIIPIREEHLDAYAWINSNPKKTARCLRFWMNCSGRTASIGW